MAKRGGFPGGAMPGNMNNLMKQAQRMQRQMEEGQKELETKEFSASAGGGAVEVTINGKKEITSIKLAEEIVDPEDIETLQDAIVAAANEAENGMKAVEKFKEVNPDLVLMDITMPEMDGIQALKEIKKLDGGAKVIMCSAMGQQAMVIESIQAGAKDFIVKPFQAERVIEAVKKVVG